jgi:hypothetical protein
MTKRLPGWAILAAAAAMAAAAFVASADVTHWVMGLHQTQVVIRPGPTIYLTSPAGQGHAHQRPLVATSWQRTLPMPGQTHRSRQDHRSRPDHKGRRPHGPGPGAGHHRGGKGPGHGRGHRHH